MSSIFVPALANCLLPLLFAGVAVAVAVISAKMRGVAAEQEAEAFKRLGFEPLQASIPSGCLFSLDFASSQHLWASALVDSLSNLEPFNRGTRRAILQAYRKLGETENILFFRYTYTISSGKSSTTYYVDACLVEWDKYFPYLAIREEGFFDRVANFVGVKDVQFEDVRFNERFHVVSNDFKFAYALFHPQMMERTQVEFLHPYTLMNDWVVLVFENNIGVNGVGIAQRTVDILSEMIPDYVAKDYHWPFTPGTSRVTAGALPIIPVPPPVRP